MAFMFYIRRQRAGDQIEYLQGYGIAGDDGRPVTPQTPFYLASLSKSFTAAAVMQLVEAGNWNWMHRFSAICPGFAWRMAMPPGDLTVRHLLAQTSGFSEVGGYERDLATSLADDTLEQSVSRG